MTTFTYTPDNAAQVSVKPRVLSSKFGDGYEQRVADGINIRPRSWRLSFNTRTTAEMTPIVAFLEARNGIEAFDWTPPSGAAGKFVCEEWARTDVRYGISDLSAGFREVYEV
jgi:phage-related protein